MARKVKGIDLERMKVDLAKNGATAAQIREITTSLRQKTELSELEQERRSMQRAIDKIDARIAKLGGASSKSAAKAKPAKKRPAKRQVKADKVLAFLSKQKSALKREDIAKGMNVESAALKSALTELVATKQLKTAGQRRGTTYIVKA